MDWLALIAIVAALLLIGFFAGVEIAFTSANKLSLELKRKQGKYTGKVWANFSNKPARFIGTMLVGFNAVLVVYGLLWSDFMADIWQNKIGDFSWSITNPYLHLVIETIIAGLCLLFFDFVFKAIFKAKNETVISSGFITYIIQFFYSLLSWVALLLAGIAKWVLKIILDVKLNEKKEVFAVADLEHFVQQSKNSGEESIEELNKELFENALSLGEIKIRECLVPRKEIEGVESHVSIEEVKNKFIQTQLSKLIVYEGNIDNIIGYVHQLDLFQNPATVKEVLLPIPAVPESMSATGLMNKFSRERKSIAWVIDEFGGTAGIVTMENLLEEIFGDIKDEYDTEEFVEKQLSDNEFIFSGRLKLNHIAEEYGLEFSKEEHTETLSGYIIQHNKQIPQLKDRIIIGNYEFNILNVSDTRIETVKLKILK